jgi:hypothetical protein
MGETHNIDLRNTGLRTDGWDKGFFMVKRNVLMNFLSQNKFKSLVKFNIINSKEKGYDSSLNTIIKFIKNPDRYRQLDKFSDKDIAQMGDCDGYAVVCLQSQKGDDDTSTKEVATRLLSKTMGHNFKYVNYSNPGEIYWFVNDTSDNIYSIPNINKRIKEAIIQLKKEQGSEHNDLFDKYAAEIEKYLEKHPTSALEPSEEGFKEFLYDEMGYQEIDRETIS